MKNNSIEIQSGIPIPDPAKQRGIYPWRLLQVGDSFFVDTKSIRMQAAQASKRLKITLTCRRVTEDGVTGVRVWRIS